VAAHSSNCICARVVAEGRLGGETTVSIPKSSKMAGKLIAAATQIMLDFTCSPNLPRICRRLSNKSLFGLPFAVNCVSVRNIVEFRALKHSLTISTRSCDRPGIFCSHDESDFSVFVCRWLSK
jgi:hypothetical protein